MKFGSLLFMDHCAISKPINDKTRSVIPEKPRDAVK